MRPHELTASEAAAAIKDGALSSAELVRSCLERIEERDEQVRAWARLDADAALAAARERDAALAAAGQRDAAPALGPLHGVPVGIKDLIDTRDLPTEYGSPVYAGHRPAADAPCVARLREAGAVVLGKTVTTEFALYEPGPTRNPHDLSRTPGGSSSGSAAAVADRMVPLALGTQTAGSIVRPAAFCGVCGLKPTFGAVPTDGVKPAAPSLDTVGPLARSVEDLALALAVMGGVDAGAAFPALAGTPRVGFARTAQWERAEPSTQQALEALAGALGEHARVEEVALPAEFADLVEAQEVIMAAEVAVSLERERVGHESMLSASLLALLATGGAREGEREAALELARRCRGRLDEAFAGCDVLLAPAVVGEAPEGIDATGDPVFCRMWTLLGVPAVAVPGLRGPSGLPLGVQVLAPLGEDRRALAAAAWLAERLGEREPAR